VPLCAAANDQALPVIAWDGAGGAIVTWYDFRNSNYDIYAQRVNAVGVAQWISNGVALCTAASTQQYPAIVSDGAGGALVAWQDFRSGSNTDIYVRGVSAAGAPQWTADGVALCTAAGDQRDPVIASDGAGGAIVAWQDFRSGTISGIYAQRVNAAGEPQWTVGGVGLCDTTNGAYSPMIVADNAGGAIVTWYDYRSRNGADIYAQRVNAVGVPVWTAAGVALCTAANSQQNPTIASDGAGGALVAWQDERSGLDIYAQRVNSAGVPQWTADGVALCTAANIQLYPTIVSDGAGGAIATWGDFRSGNADIYAQRVNAAGVPQWTADGVAVCRAGNYQYNPKIVSDGAGGGIVTWFDARSGSSYRIYAQRVNAAGVPQWTVGGVALSTTANTQLDPTIVSDGAGGAIVTWQDLRKDYGDIYAQNINSDGTLGGGVVSTPPLSVTEGFTLSNVEPNPSVGEVRVIFSLLDGTPATLELYDLTGRRIESLSVGSLGAGAHVMSLNPRVLSLPPGVYCVRLAQGNHRAFRRVAIVR
jgi:hypothetical protein